MTGSEFGRGYATCLRQFTFHRKRLDGYLASYAKLRSDNPDLFAESEAVELWFNGASDHLADLVRPVRGVSRAEWGRAKALQARALDIGHGFRPRDKSDRAEAVGLLDLAYELLVSLERRGHKVETLDEAMETDRALGIKPEAGSWSCSADIERRSA